MVEADLVAMDLVVVGLVVVGLVAVEDLAAVDSAVADSAVADSAEVSEVVAFPVAVSAEAVLGAVGKVCCDGRTCAIPKLFRDDLRMFFTTILLIPFLADFVEQVFL